MQKNCAKYNIGVTKVSKELSKIAEQNEIAAAESNGRILCRLNNMRLTTDQSTIEKKVQGRVYDKEGKSGFKSSAGFLLSSLVNIQY
jgi:hypothetical protein